MTYPIASKCEYVIWGYPPESNEHSLLVGTYNDGTPITEKNEANRIIELMKAKGCTKVTIQTIDMQMGMNDFSNDWVNK